jgi:anti-anti-sigma regulatory factor
MEEIGALQLLLRAAEPMLRITIEEEPDSLRLRIEGKLVGAWAKELEQSWKRVAECRDHKALLIDLTDTLYIDDEGKRVLKKLFGEGASFQTAGAMTSSVVDEIKRTVRC